MRKLQLYADGIRPDKALIDSLIAQGITGATANPSLAKNHCYKQDDVIPAMNYEAYSKFLITHFYPFPVSVQVLSSDIPVMYEQAQKIASWGESAGSRGNVYVKIPIITIDSESTAPLIVKLLEEGIRVNVTAIFTDDQVIDLTMAGLDEKHDCILSVFCGRIADTGLDPQDNIEQISNAIGERGKIKLLWAGVRSALDIRMAEKHCDIITIPQGVLDKLPMKGKDLNEYCLDTVKMFDRDAKNFTI